MLKIQFFTASKPATNTFICKDKRWLQAARKHCYLRFKVFIWQKHCSNLVCYQTWPWWIAAVINMELTKAICMWRGRLIGFILTDEWNTEHKPDRYKENICLDDCLPGLYSKKSLPLKTPDRVNIPLSN